MNERDIFIGALQQADTSARRAYLQAACGDDVALRQRVEGLLRLHEQAGSFLESPIGELGATPDEDVAERSLTQEALPTPTGWAAEVGSRIGPYALVQKLGEGGMGAVWVAAQSHPVKRRVALKLIKAGMNSRHVIRRFEAERQALALMDHNNIAKVLDAGATETGQPYFVMELVKGVPITKYCDELQLSLRERLELFVPVCQAIQHAHQKGIIHRDVKPSNVLIAMQDGKPVPKVIDFGVAKALREPLTEQSLYTEIGQVVGTLEYMSPEQAELSALDIDTRADVYALGVLLYELLTGTTPLERKGLRETPVLELLRQIREEEPPRPSTRLGHSETLPEVAAARRTEPVKLAKLVRGELDWIVMKCLEKDRNRRYETANGLARDIERYLHDEPVLACPPSAGYRLRKLLRRHRTAAGVTMGFLFLLAAGAATSTYFAYQADKRAMESDANAATAKANEEKAIANAQMASTEKTNAENNAKQAKANEKTAQANELLARRRFYAAQMNLAMQAWEAGDNARALSLLETQRPRFDDKDLRTFEWYCLWRLCHPGLQLSRRLVRGNTYKVACSPDGTLIACAGSDGKVRLFDTATGKERAALQEKGRGSEIVAFSPDGRLLAQAAGSEVMLWDVAAGRKHASLSGTGWVHRLSFSPDGLTLATGNTDGVVQLRDVATGQLKATWKERPRRVDSLSFSPDGKVLAVSWFGAAPDGLTGLWDVTVVPPQRLVEIPTWLNDLAFSPDGKVLAGTTSGILLALWDRFTGKKIPLKKPLEGGTGLALAFSRDGQKVALGLESRCVKLFDLATGRQQTLPHHSMVNSIALSRDGRLLASVSEDAMLKVWDLTRGLQADVLQVPGGVTCLAFSADSAKLAVGGYDKNVRLYDAASGKLTATLPGHTQIIQALAFSPDGCKLASGAGPFYGPGETKVWDLATKQEVAGFPEQKDATYAVAFSPDGKTLASGGPSGKGCLWNVPSLQLRATWKGKGILALAFASDGEMLVAGGLSGAIEFRSPVTGQESQIVKGMNAAACAQHSIFALAFSPDGNLLAAGATDGTVWQWEYRTGKLLGVLRGQTSRISCLGFFPDSNTLASASWGGIVRLWDVATGQERLTFKGGTRAAVAPDGKTLAIGAGAEVRLYRAATDAEAAAYKTELDPADPESPVAQNNAGDLFWKAGQIVEAKEAFNKARLRLEKLAARFPDVSDYSQELVRALFGLGRALTDHDSPSEQGDEIGRKLAALVRTLPEDLQPALLDRFLGRGDELHRVGQVKQAEKVFKQILTGCQELAAAHPNEPGFRDGLARSHQNLARLAQRGGRLEDAETHFRRTIAIWEKLAADFPDDPSWPEQVAHAHRALAFHLRDLKRPEEATKHLRKAFELLEQSLTDFPPAPRRSSLMGDTIINLAGLLPVDSEAEKLYRRALGTFKKLADGDPNEPSYQVDAGHCLWHLADSLRATGRTEEAHKALREALANFERLAAEFPAEPFYQLEVAYTYWARLGPFFASQTGRLRDAEQAYRLGLAAHEKLVADFPTRDPEYHHRLRSNYDALANLVKNNGRAHDAEQVYRRAIKFYEKVATAHPNESGLRDGLARSRHSLAELLQEIGQKKEAAKAFREAIAIWEKLAADFPAKPEYGQHVTYTYGQLAALLNNDGQVEEAIKILQQEIKRCETLVAQAPANAEIIRERLRQAYHSLGGAQRACGRHEEAVKSLSQAAAIAEQLVRDFPDKAWYADRLHDAHAELASTFISTRRCSEGEKFYSEAIKLQPNDAMLWFRRAEFYGRLGLWDLAAKDSAAAFKLPPPATPLQCFAHAFLSLYTGDLDSYRQLCTWMPKQFSQNTYYGTGENALPRACTTVAVPEADLTWAVQRAEGVVKSEPNNPSSYCALGRARFRADDYKQAVTQLERSLKVDANWDQGGPTYPVLAMAYNHLGQREKAKEALQKAAEAIDRGLDVLSRGPAGTLPMPWWEDWLESYLLYREAKTLIDGSPPTDDPRWYVARAHAFVALGDQKKANDSYLKAAELGATADLRSRFVKGYLDLAWSLIHANPRRLKEAEKVCRNGIAMVEQMIARFPEAVRHRWELADLRCALGWAFQHGRRPTDAAKAFQEEAELREQLIAKGGSKPEQRVQLSRAYTFLGIALGSAGRLEEAVKAHRRALGAVEQLAADFPKEASYQQRVALCHANLASLLQQTTQLDEAERHFQQGIRLYEGHPDWKDDQGVFVKSLFGLAQILSKRGRNEEAARTYRRFLELQPAR